MPSHLQQFFPLIGEPKSKFIEKALAWSNQFTYSAYFDPNQFNYPFQPFKHMLGVADEHAFVLEANQDHAGFFQLLKKEHKRKWLMGFLGYDLKNELEQLASENFELLPFPKALLFEPGVRLEWQDDLLKIEAKNPQDVFDEIWETKFTQGHLKLEVATTPCFAETEYLHQVEQIRTWIENGEVYELNFCLAHKISGLNLQASQLFSKLNAKSPAPFAGYLNAREFGIVSASPERFMKRSGDMLISQPIKGTAPRNLNNPKKDAALAEELRKSEKEQAENLMIVDLTRNDLSRSCEPGTVAVHELFGIYSFSQVHQMISTVIGTKRKEVHFSEAIASAFPMGSMTGAPKIKAMELIEQLENFKRGPFSGTFGYIDPEGQFDFNVLIRSIFFNKQNGHGMFATGSAITYDSNPVSEWQECAMKGKAIAEVLETLG